MSSGSEENSDLLHRRIMFSMLGPAAYLAARLDFPLKELTHFMRLSYVRELRASGVTLAEAAERIEVSTRTLKRLNAELRSDFFLPEIEQTLARRIEFMVWAEPQSQARLSQLLPGVEVSEIELALATLLDEGRVEMVEEGRTARYRAVKQVTSLVSENFARRIGALNSLVQNVAETVVARFIEPRAGSFARTLNFRVREEDLVELETAYRELLDRMLELEAKADSTSVPIRMSVLWTPVDE